MQLTSQTLRQEEHKAQTIYVYLVLYVPLCGVTCFNPHPSDKLLPLINILRQNSHA